MELAIGARAALNLRRLNPRLEEEHKNENTSILRKYGVHRRVETRVSLALLTCLPVHMDKKVTA